MMNDVTISEKECEVDEVKEDDCCSVTGRGITYQRNVYHFGYPVFHDGKNETAFVPRKLETTEL